MKPIILNEKEQKKLFEDLYKQLVEKLKSYTFDDEGELTVSTKLGEKAKEKVKLIYSPMAYLRMRTLVDKFDSEISWFGLVKRLDKKAFYIYDVLVCKQKVNGGKVDTEDDDMLDFITNLTDEQSENMFFQAHSHVNFPTRASGTDMQNQEDILNGMPGHEGFYIFQIWNKKGEISTYLYDLDNNTFYDKNDVEMQIQDEVYGSLDAFLEYAKKLVGKIEIRPTVYQKGQWGYSGNYRDAYYGGYYDYPKYPAADYDEDDFEGVTKNELGKKL